MDAGPQDSSTPWLLLLHQVPPKPDYLRVKVRRRLQRVGAVAIKNSVYALPRSEQSLEDFQWILREIEELGGRGVICEASILDGLPPHEVEALFHTERDADFRDIAEEAVALQGEPEAAPRRAELQAGAARLARRLEEAMAIDFFGAPERSRAEHAVRTLQSLLRAEPAARLQEDAMAVRPSGRVWVTRQGVRVDRIASAWLIRRFIDCDAQFRFVVEREYVHQVDEQRFDMFEGEFSHEGDRCTFEVLIQRFGLEQSGLAPIAEIIHDLDLKDGKYGRAETSGVERTIAGIVANCPRDEDRIARGVTFLDDLLAAFRPDGQGANHPWL
jgi:hypothetical protein